MVYDDEFQADVIDFQVLSSLPVEDGTVDAATWYKLNQTSYLVGRGEMKPLRAIAGPPQTLVSAKEKQPTDNAINATASAAFTLADGSRLLVKTQSGDNTDTGSAAQHNQTVDREISRKTKRDISSLPGRAMTPFRPSGVAHKKKADPKGRLGLVAAGGGFGLVAVIAILILIFKPEWVGL